MANIDDITYTGIQTKDNNILVEELITGFQDIYGQNDEELNLDSNTPDRQLIELFAFAGTIVREMYTEVYNSCDPDKCVGAIQDNRYQINYLERKAGSYTLQNITIVANKTVTLQGLDASFADPEASAYTVSDNNGNIWYLSDTTTILAGTTSLEFRAKNKGVIIPTIGTITNQVTIVDGIISVINNVGATSIGTEQESDSDFRIRRERSVQNSGQNNIDAMLGNILALENVVDANIHENRTDATDVTGTPAHSIWVIVEGGANTDIGNIIYANIGGAGTKGNVIVPITTASLQQTSVSFDREIVLPLYIKFDIKAITNVGEVNQDFVKEYIAQNLTYRIGENVETSKITQIAADAMLADGGDGYALDVKVSAGGSATVTTTSATISDVSVVSSIFQDAMGDTTGTYTFTYTTDGWEYSGNLVSINDYGIYYTGEPDENDEIEVSYTAGTWTDYLAVDTIADKYTTDTKKIYITAI